VSLGLLLTAGLAWSCRSAGPIGDPERFVRPVVAVESFENRAPFPLRWDLGEGMAEQLTASLVRSGRFEVVSRASLDSVLDELELQHDPRFRPEGRLAPGRLKNARYLVRGAVVDFGHVAGGGLHFMRGLVHGRTKGYVAEVSITLTVVDIETREERSASFEGQAWAGEAGVDAVYGKVAFGGSAFYRTPLGHATEEAIWKALHWLVEQVASETWQPLIARVEEDRVYLNGGLDRGVVVGEELEVLAPGEAIIDPATGDILGHTAERLVGRLRVVMVEDRFAVAEVVEGDSLEVGQSCRRLDRPASKDGAGRGGTGTRSTG
jgi:curli biogenesis system outer membrane secretion channel CsgG